MSTDQSSARPNRRGFLGRAGGAAAMFTSGALATPVGGSIPIVCGGLPPGVANKRVIEAFTMRVAAATRDATLPVGINADNGDEAAYADKSGVFTKGLPHDSFGKVDQTAYATFKTALLSGRFSDFEQIPMGGTRTLNGPQGGLATHLDTPEGIQFGHPEVPPAPTLASDQSGVELLEHYWAALLRDTPFGGYSSNPMAAAAALELTGLPGYVGPRNDIGQVTPDLLFRGSFAGSQSGPHISQFFLMPTMFGAQPISQQMATYLPGVDFVTTFSDWVAVQNGATTGLRNQTDPSPRYVRNGRDLAAYTHVDVLFQAYFTAFLILTDMGAPLNPGNPYAASACENGFGTFGGPDIASALGEVAVKALNIVWYQKWFVHLRPRPEVLGGFVHLVKAGQGDKTDMKPSPVILNSEGLRQSFNKYGSWLLPQAYPEGSPTHPAYPTGHGAVGGACVTLLKFFFDGNYRLPNPVVPSDDGLTLLPYSGPDRGLLTVNGELNKLGYNVSFGHGIHAGIHWRSDSDTSLMLGEAVALGFLRDRALTYNEPFTVQLTKFDGTVATISNQG